MRQKKPILVIYQGSKDQCLKSTSFPSIILVRPGKESKDMMFITGTCGHARRFMGTWQQKELENRYEVLRLFGPCLKARLAITSLAFIFSHLAYLCFLTEEEDSDSGSEVDTKKTGRRHKLLRKKLTLSEGESENDKPAKSNKEVKRRGRRKGRRLPSQRPPWRLTHPLSKNNSRHVED